MQTLINKTMKIDDIFYLLDDANVETLVNINNAICDELDQPFDKVYPVDNFNDIKFRASYYFIDDYNNAHYWSNFETEMNLQCNIAEIVYFVPSLIDLVKRYLQPTGCKSTTGPIVGPANQ